MRELEREIVPSIAQEKTSSASGGSRSLEISCKKVSRDAFLYEKSGMLLAPWEMEIGG